MSYEYFEVPIQNHCFIFNDKHYRIMYLSINTDDGRKYVYYANEGYLNEKNVRDGKLYHTSDCPHCQEK